MQLIQSCRRLRMFLSKGLLRNWTLCCPLYCQVIFRFTIDFYPASWFLKLVPKDQTFWTSSRFLLWKKSNSMTWNKVAAGEFEAVAPSPPLRQVSSINSTAHHTKESNSWIIQKFDSQLKWLNSSRARALIPNENTDENHTCFGSHIKTTRGFHLYSHWTSRFMDQNKNWTQKQS